MRWLVALVAVAACGKSDEPAPQPGSATGADRVEGSLLVDGKQATLRACRPGHTQHTFVEVVTSLGKLRFEDAKLYWTADVEAVSPGAELRCDDLRRSWGGGVRTDNSTYWRGKLIFKCSGPAAVSGTLELDCGGITDAERKQLDANRKDLIDQQTGSAAP